MCVLVEDDLEDGIGMQKGMDQFMSEANKETHVEITTIQNEVQPMLLQEPDKKPQAVDDKVKERIAQQIFAKIHLHLVDNAAEDVIIVALLTKFGMARVFCGRRYRHAQCPSFSFPSPGF